MPDNVVKLLKLLSQGKTLQQASRKIGVSQTAAYRLVQRFGREANRRTKPKLTTSTKSSILEMRRAGSSIALTARLLKVSRWSVRRYSRQPESFRCAGCGGRTIVMPCPVCEARRLKGIK